MADPVQKMWDYSLLRAIHDGRPPWAQRIGLHTFEQGGVVIKRAYPRLVYRREEGSHIASKHDPKLPEKEAKFSERLGELWGLHLGSG